MANTTTIDKRKREDRYIPGKPSADLLERRRLFDGLNAFIIDRCGWITSIPGRAEIVFETLPGSRLPDELGELGYKVKPADPPEGQRLLATAITEYLTLTSSGGLEPLTPGSTKRAMARTHAGIVKVERFSFPL
jgi:hypothetical protein